MALEHQDENPQIKIVFGGLNTHVSELFIENFDSPDMLNVDLDPISTMRKRDGLQYLYASYNPMATRNDRGPGEMLKWLYRMADQDSFLYSMRGGTMIKYDMYNPPVHPSLGLIGTTWTAAFLPDSAGASFTDEVDPADPDTWVYKGEALYLSDKLNEPIILLGEDYAVTSLPDGPFQTMDWVVEGGTGYIKGTYTTTHGLVDGDILKVDFSPDVPGEWNYFPLYGHYLVEVIDTTNIYLRNGDLKRLVGDLGWSPASSTWYSIEKVTSSGFTKWPLGQYGTSTGVRGYPERWVDPDGVGIDSNGWPDYSGTPGDTDWPSHLHVIGQGLGSRMFAYGFKKDPDRIDYSELGVPYNFLKSDVFATDEAAAVTVPSTDGGYFYALRGDGDRVVAVRELLGNTVVFKTRKTLIWGGEIGEYFRISHALAVGAVNDASVVKIGNDIYFWSYDGPRRLSPSFQSQDLMDSSVSAEIIEVVNSLSQENNRKIEARHERRKQRIVWHFPAAGSSDNNQCLVYYYPTSADPKGRWSLWSGRYCEMAQTVAIEDPLTGQSEEYGIRVEDGCVWRMNRGSTDGEVLEADADPSSGLPDDPVDPAEYYSIGMRYRTKWFDIETPTSHKRILTAMVIYGRDGSGLSQIFIGEEYDETWREMKFPIAQSGNLAQPNETIFWNQGLWSGDPEALPEGTGDPADPPPQDYPPYPVPSIGFQQNGYWNGSGRGLVVYEAEGIGRVFRLLIAESSSLPVSISGIVLGPSRKGTR